MRILVFSTWFPYPPDNGSRIRAFEIANGLAQRHELEMIAFHKPDEPPSTAWARFPVHPVPEPVPRTGKIAGLRGLLSPWPRHLHAQRSAPARNVLSDRLLAFNPHALLAIELPAAVHALSARGIPKAMDLLQLAEIQGLTDPKRGLLRAWRGQMTWWKYVRFVRMIVRSFDWIFSPTEEEKRLLDQAARQVCHASVVPNGVDPEKWKPSELGDPLCLIYPGSLKNPFNWDAVSSFCDQVLPRIRAQIPEVHLRVTGRAEPWQRDRLSGRPGIELTGYIEDMPNFLVKHGICVVPLRSGGGSRIKILECLAAGITVVSTSKGAEGLGLRDREEILLADGPEGFAKAVVEAIQDRGLRGRLATQGRARVLRDYTWSGSVEAIEGTLERLHVKR